MIESNAMIQWKTPKVFEGPFCLVQIWLVMHFTIEAATDCILLVLSGEPLNETIRRTRPFCNEIHNTRANWGLFED